MSIFKKQFFLAFFLFIVSNSFLSAQGIYWAKGFGNTNSDYGNGITTDAMGNIYLTGEFYTSVTFAPLATMTSVGNVDYYVVKLDSAGNGLWQRKGGASATNTDRGYGIKLDNRGNVITGGVFIGSATFQGGANADVTLTGAGNLDGFTAKYDISGNLLWIKQAGGTSQDRINRVAVDKYNNVIIAGYFGSGTVNSVVFDGVTLLTTNSNLSRDMFVARYDSNGVFQWAKSAGSTGSDEGRGVTVDDAGNIYVCGTYAGAAGFGGLNLTFAGVADAFVAKYSPTGDIVWVKSIGGLKTDEAHGIVYDGYGNIYVSGNFDSAAVFHLFSGDTSVVSNGGKGYDVYLTKFDTAGNQLWVRSGGGAGPTFNEYGYDVTTDIFGNVSMTGSFRGKATFGTTQIDSIGTDDVFIAKYDSAGTLLWLTSGGGATLDRGFAIASDLTGSLVVTGRYNTSASFGGISMPATSGTNPDNIFLAKINNFALPVELTSFTAKKVNGNVLLNWRTATELNNHGFDIERKDINSNWVKIAFIPGNGTTNSPKLYSFSDNNLSENNNFFYRLRQVDNNGKSKYSNEIEVNLNSVPGAFSLEQNYPNPFNPSTTIRYNLPVNSFVNLKIYNTLGQEVATLVNEMQQADFHEVSFDASKLNSGVYFYSIKAGDKFVQIKKMILIK